LTPQRGYSPAFSSESWRAWYRRLENSMTLRLRLDFFRAFLQVFGLFLLSNYFVQLGQIVHRRGHPGMVRPVQGPFHILSRIACIAPLPRNTFLETHTVRPDCSGRLLCWDDQVRMFFRLLQGLSWKCPPLQRISLTARDCQPLHSVPATTSPEPTRLPKTITGLKTQGRF
jgi:hypothetical protein